MSALGDFTAISVVMTDGIVVATIDNPPINLLTPDLFGDFVALADRWSSHRTLGCW